MPKLQQSRGDFVWSIILLMVGLIIMISSLQLGFGGFAVPGPGIFPFFCGLILCIQSVMLHVFKSISPPTDLILSDASRVKKFFFVIMTFSLWVILMPFLGWLLLTFLVTLSIAKIMKMEGWFKPALLSLANTLLLYILFGHFLSIDLPNGFWM